MKSLSKKSRGLATARVWAEGSRLWLSLIALMIVVLCVWASLEHVDRVVRVEGKIIPAGRSQQIQHLEGGIVRSIEITEGQFVKRGDLLLTIDPTAADSSLNETTSKTNALRLRVARLGAEEKGLNAVEFPADIAHLPEADAERRLFQDRREKLLREVSVHESTIHQTSAEIAQAEDHKAKLTQEMGTAHERSELLKNLAGHEAASKMEVLGAVSTEQRLGTEIADVSTSIPKLKSTIDGEQARIAAAKQEFETQAQNDLVAALDEITRLNQVGREGQARLKRTEIRAPIDGTINRISINTVGGIIKPGETLVELIPDTKEVLIEAKAQPKDRGLLAPNLVAEVRVSAYDAAELGLLQGRVTEVSADSIADAHNETYYRVNILVKDVPSAYVGKNMVPGMTATADIVTGKRTIMSYLLSPITKFQHNIFRDAR